MHTTQLYTHILFRVKFFCFILWMYLIASCTVDNEYLFDTNVPVIDSISGYGRLELTLANPTRATSTVVSKEEADNYWITIYKGEDLSRETTRLKELDTSLPAGYGYTLLAESCLESEAEGANDGWGQRRYWGHSASFAIKPGETTQVGVNCSVVNAGVEVIFDKTIPNHFTISYSVSIIDGERTIVFDANSGGKSEDGVVSPSKVAYYNVDDSGSRSLVYKIEAFGEGKQLMKTSTITLSKAKITRLILTFIPGTLDLDVLVSQENIYVNQDIIITENDVIQDDGTADVSGRHDDYEDADNHIDIFDYEQL